MRSLRSLVMALALGTVMLAPFAVFAADTNALQEGWTLYPDACKCDAANNNGIESAPDFRCVGLVLNNLVNLALSVGVVIFVLVASYAGVLFMASSVNPHGKEQAKSMLMSAVIGLIIALAAWLLVDFVMSALYNKKWGPWNSILENRQAKACLVVITPPAGPSTGSNGTGGVTGTPGTSGASIQVGSEVLCEFDGTENTVGTVTDISAAGDTLTVAFTGGNTAQVPARDCRLKGGDTTGPGTGSSDWMEEFTFQGDVSSQAGAVSSALNTVLSCMASRAPSNVGELSALTDRYSGTSRDRISSCAATGSQGNSNCAHTINSAHYGGVYCRGSSYAADFGDETNAADLISAANACGAIHASIHNTNHVHVTAPNQCCEASPNNSTENRRPCE